MTRSAPATAASNGPTAASPATARATETTINVCVTRYLGAKIEPIGFFGERRDE